MSWPLSQDYNESIQDPATSFGDAELKTGEAVTNPLGIPMPRSGNFADVYEVRCPSGSRWAVKCFTREVAGLRERYHEISKYLHQANLPFMVDFQYLEQGIRVRGQWYPILKMQWVEGFVLNEFVRDNLDKKPILQAMGQIWLRMARRLREANLAHCDLQHGNVLLVPGSTGNSLAVKLIDYDGMCVPALRGSKSGEVGHPAFQHPERLRTGAYNQEVDRFSLLAIATGLRCLTVGGRSLWERYDNGDNLLFRQSDLQEPTKSPLFEELLAIRDPQAQPLVKELYRACQGPLNKVPLLTDLLPEEKPVASAIARGKSPAATTAEPNAFQDIEAESTERRARRKTVHDRGGSLIPWIVGGSVAACALLGGVLFWALHARSQSKEASLQPEPRQERAEIVVPAKIVMDKGAPLPAEKPQIADPPPPPPDKGEDKPPKPEAAIAQPFDGPLGEVRHFEGHTGDVTHVAFSPDGKRALTASHDKSVRLWDLATGESIHTLNGHTQTVWSVAFSADGKRAVSAGDDNTARVWDLGKGEEIRTIRGYPSAVQRAVFTADGRQIFAAGRGKSVRLCDAETGTEIRRYTGSQADNYWLALHPKGEVVLSGGDDMIVHSWNVADGRELEPYKASIGPLYAIEYSRDGQLIAAAGDDLILHIWRASDRTLLHSLKGHSAKVNEVNFTADGRLLSASLDQTVRLWDVVTGLEVGRFYGPEGCKMLSMAVSPDGRYFLSSGSDHKVRLWRLPPPDVLASKPDDPADEVRIFKGHSKHIRRVAISSDGRLALSAGHDNTARVWEMATGRELLVFRGHTHREVHSAAFLPDGQHALSSGDDNFLRLWKVSDGQEIRRFEGHGAPVHHLAVSPDGRQALSCHPTKGVILWNLETGAIIYRLAKEPDGASCVRFSADGRWGLSGIEATISVWDLKSGERVRQFKGDMAGVMSVAFSLDGQYVLSGSDDKTVRLWDAKTGKEVQRFEGHTAPVWGVAPSPDGRRVLSASMDRTVRLWDAATGKELARFGQHTDGVLDVAFSPDGRYALSGGQDNTLRLWRLPFVPFVVGRPLPINSKSPAPIVARFRVPDGASQKKSTEDIRDIYKADYVSRQTDDRIALAVKLLKRGMANQEEVGRRYVYLREARDLAARSGDFALSLRAIDEMTKTFDVPPLPMQTAALELAAKAPPRGPDAPKFFVEQALTIVDEAEAVDDYEQALKLLRIAQSVAMTSRDRSVRGVVSQRQNRLKRLQTEYAKIPETIRSLADKPDEAEANRIMGKFYCFDKEDWSKGLPMLARGADATLAELARKDLANPTETSRQAELGQAWWAFADKPSDTNIKTAGRRRARYWLLAALPSLSGAEADRVSSQLEVKQGKLKFRPGLVTELFAGENFERRVKARLDYKIANNWGYAAPGAGVPADHFSVRWQGILIPPRAGKYTFVLHADDGARLIVDDKSVIDAWRQIGRHTAELSLNTTPHLIRVEFREVTGPAAIHFGWALKGGFKEQIVPPEVLYHDLRQERLLVP